MPSTFEFLDQEGVWRSTDGAEEIRPGCGVRMKIIGVDLSRRVSLTSLFTPYAPWVCCCVVFVVAYNTQLDTARDGVEEYTDCQLLSLIPGGTRARWAHGTGNLELA
jgi:hypothetical protein